tara:strand:- start:2681 stop:3322 length:642 start_codon:yes stop_codon:yes gene_type:complete
MVRKFRKANSIIKLKRFVYLISPKYINNLFFKNLNEVLSSKKVKYFQIRLKNKSKKSVIKEAKKIQKITKKYKVKLIINDSIEIASKVNADGCHLGQKDDPIAQAKKILKKKLLGVTCHNSKRLCKDAVRFNADYVAFGSFFKSKSKPYAIKANISILRWAKKNVKKKIVAIGGINSGNYKKLINAGANYIAISSYIWNNPKFKPKDAISKFI